MNFITYQTLFQSILTNPHPAAPYDNPAYFNYVKLNWSRQQRWLKVGVLNKDLISVIQKITTPQHWIVITEPWCGDASHTIPFIEKLTELNPLLTVKYQLRDTAPFLIENYLSHGTKSIPKLIIRNAQGDDLAVWGPRPVECQALYMSLKESKADYEITKIALQQWYNDDKGKSFQLELLALLNNS